MSDAEEIGGEPRDSPAVSEEVRTLIQAGRPREALRRYQEETGAEMGEALAALGQAARDIRRG